MKKVKKKQAPTLTTLKIDVPTHARVKQYCIDNEYWIHLFVEKVLNDYMDKNKSHKSL